MSFDCCHQRDWARVALGVWLLCSCANETLTAQDVAVQASQLELECGTGAADAFGDVLAILSSIEPLDPSQPQAYGSQHCTGFVFEFDNPENEPLHGAWVQASDESGTPCPERSLEADYWGYKDRAWTKLASASAYAVFETRPRSGAGYCRLDALLEHAGAFDKLRIVARVTQGSERYPMYACLW